MAPTPKVAKGLVLRKAAEPGPYGFKNDAALVELPIPELKPNQILVKINAIGFNHKDVWTRKGLYPGIAPGRLYGGDGAGLVIASGTPKDDLVSQRVFLTPSRGWWADPVRPESRFVVLGCTPVEPGGTFAEYIVVDREHVIRTPDHLDDVHAAAWPIGGVTAWRATMVNGKVSPGQNVLITGIGGGVALLALQLCIAAGASVYVTSGSPEKIQKAVALGAKGGANYKDKNWPAQIGALLQKEKNGLLDVVVDSGGGDILNQAGKYIKAGGRVVCYGMTAAPTITMTMRQVLQNLQLLGSTMGSHKDLEDATEFIAKHKIVPIISQVLEGLENAEQGFQILNKGEQFGKVVLKVRHNEAKL